MNASKAYISAKKQVREVRAKKEYVPATREMQQLGEANENVLAKLIKGKSTGDNDPFDVLILNKAGERLHQIEVKTLIKSKVDKITMRRASRLRKLEDAEKHLGAQVHTIVFDNRRGAKKIFYSHGVGSFRLGGMRELSKNEKRILLLIFVYAKLTTLYKRLLIKRKTKKGKNKIVTDEFLAKLYKNMDTANYNDFSISTDSMSKEQSCNVVKSYLSKVLG